jgi:hypothetical protein
MLDAGYPALLSGSRSWRESPVCRHPGRATRHRFALAHSGRRSPFMTVQLAICASDGAWGWDFNGMVRRYPHHEFLQVLSGIRVVEQDI